MFDASFYICVKLQVCVMVGVVFFFFCFFVFQAEDGIRDLVRSRGLGDVYKRQYQQLTSLEVMSLMHALNQILSQKEQSLG